MKNLLPLLAFIILFLAGCDKDETAPVTYMPNTANSTWNFNTQTYAPTPATGSFTLKATNQDTLINGRTYRVFTHTNAQNDYYAQVGSDYYQLGSVGNLSAQRVELLFLKDAATGTTWSETHSITLTGVPIPITVPINYRIVKKDFDTTVSGKAYTGVTHVKVTLGSTNFLGTTITPTSDLNFYYARGIGRIYSRTKVAINTVILGNPFVTNIDEEQTLTSYTIQ